MAAHMQVIRTALLKEGFELVRTEVCQQGLQSTVLQE